MANLQICNRDRAVIFTSWKNVITGGTGTYLISGAQGDNAVTMAGYNNVIVLVTGTNMVQAGDGDET